MAKRSQSLSSLLPGTLAAVAILGLLFSAMLSLWLFAFDQTDLNFIFSPALWRILGFTLFQAALSTVFSVVFALILAKAYYPLRFYGKALLLRLFALTFVLPSLVLVSSLPSIYGRHGGLATLCQWFGVDYSFSLYGIQGIIIAHVFYNFPFAFRLFYQSLAAIPLEQRQLAAQLGFSYWQHVRYLEWPVLLRQIPSIASLIFMLCFTSFAVVLTLGGGPKNTSFEVAIFQALRDFELDKAVILSLVQTLLCLLFMVLVRRLTPPSIMASQAQHPNHIGTLSTLPTLISYIIVGLSALFILSPLVVIVINGMAAFSITLITSTLIQAILNSLTIAFCAATVTLLLAISLLWTYSRLLVRGYRWLSESMIVMGSLILIIPTMVLASGLFLLFFTLSNVSWFIAILVIISNGLATLPFALKILEGPMETIYQRYHCLSQSLNITGVNHFYWIEVKGLKTLFCFTFAFACMMSMGDFGIIALFGQPDFATLPYYLYQQMGSYQQQQADFTALLLLMICLLLFYLTEILMRHYDRT